MKRSVFAAVVTGLLSIATIAIVAAFVMVPNAEARPTPVPTSGGGGGPAGIANQAIAPSQVTLGDPPQPGFRQTIRATGVGDGGLYVAVGNGEKALEIAGNGQLVLGNTQLAANGSSLSWNVAVLGVSNFFITGAGGTKLGPNLLSACGGAVAEGTIVFAVTSAGAVTRFCICASDGTNFEWVNMLNPSDRSGTTLVCPTSGTL